MTHLPYQDKPRENKRLYQLMMTARLKDLSTLNPNLCDGTVVFLSGPNPEEAKKYYEKYKVGQEYIGVEKDKKVWAEAWLRKTSKTRVINNDIFEVTKRYKQEVRGIDFDFCTTVTDKTASNIVNTVTCMQNPTIWFRVTSSMRGSGGKKGLNRRKEEIKESIEKLSSYKVIDECSIGYKDSIAMNSWQVVLRDNNRKEEGTMRTFKELNSSEQDMVRALVDEKHDNRTPVAYTDEEIARVFNLSPVSISALKAHVTMRNKN